MMICVKCWNQWIFRAFPLRFPFFSRNPTILRESHVASPLSNPHCQMCYPKTEGCSDPFEVECCLASLGGSGAILIAYIIIDWSHISDLPYLILSHSIHSILNYSISILNYSISILFLFYFYSIPISFYSILFHPIPPFHSIPFHSIPSIPFHSIPFHSIPLSHLYTSYAYSQSDGIRLLSAFLSVIVIFDFGCATYATSQSSLANVSACTRQARRWWDRALLALAMILLTGLAVRAVKLWKHFFSRSTLAGKLLSVSGQNPCTDSVRWEDCAHISLHVNGKVGLEQVKDSSVHFKILISTLLLVLYFSISVIVWSY